MTSAEPGIIVTWKFGTKPPMRFTGRIETINGELALISANGVVYEVNIRRLRKAYVCAQCGKTIHSRNAKKYCSIHCYYDELHAEHDEWVFQAIIQFKAEHDGYSPSFRQVARLAGIAEQSAQRAMYRLKETGRIKVIGNNRHWGIVIPGGRWVYEGANP